MQYALREFFRHPEDMAKAGLTGGLDGKRVIVQGLGNVGYHAAKFLSEEDGAKVIAVIERDGALVDDRGPRHRGCPSVDEQRHGGLLADFPAATFVDGRRRGAGTCPATS